MLDYVLLKVREGFMLYHKDVFLPANIKSLSPRTFEPIYGRHSFDQASAKMFTLPRSVTFSGQNVIEAEVENGKTVKVVVRLPYSNSHDIVLVIRNNGFIKTAWLNSKSDRHNALDRSRYAAT